MISKKNVLSFPPELTDKPIIYRLTKDFGLEFNILKAAISENEKGLLILELKGEVEQYNKGIEYLKKIGVKIEPLSKDVVMVDEVCISCGACVPQCPSGALIVDPETREVNFDYERCVACEMCVRMCPYKAMEIRW